MHVSLDCVIRMRMDCIMYSKEKNPIINWKFLSKDKNLKIKLNVSVHSIIKSLLTSKS